MTPNVTSNKFFSFSVLPVWIYNYLTEITTMKILFESFAWVWRQMRSKPNFNRKVFVFSRGSKRPPENHQIRDKLNTKPIALDFSWSQWRKHTDRNKIQLSVISFGELSFSQSTRFLTTAPWAISLFACLYWPFWLVRFTVVIQVLWDVGEGCWKDID